MSHIFSKNFPASQNSSRKTSPFSTSHGLVAANFRSCGQAAAQKSAIYGEGYARHAGPGAQKSAIPEKEIVIFALRKVLFPGKAWSELPGASTTALQVSLEGRDELQ
jgi:hypothetical protein